MACLGCSIFPDAVEALQVDAAIIADDKLPTLAFWVNHTGQAAVFDDKLVPGWASTPPAPDGTFSAMQVLRALQITIPPSITSPPPAASPSTVTTSSSTVTKSSTQKTKTDAPSQTPTGTQASNSTGAELSGYRSAAILAGVLGGALVLTIIALVMGFLYFRRSLRAVRSAMSIQDDKSSLARAVLSKSDTESQFTLGVSSPEDFLDLERTESDAYYSGSSDGAPLGDSEKNFV